MHTRRPFYKKPAFIIICSVALFLGAVIRLILPQYTLKLVNYELSRLSPHISLHTSGIEMQVLRGDYTLRDIHAHLKDSGKVFLRLKSLNFQTNWKNIWRGDLFARIYADQMLLTISPEAIVAMKAERTRLHRSLTNSHFKIKKIAITDSQIGFENFDKSINDLTLEINNLKNFNLTASVFDPSPMRLYGTMNLKSIPIHWDLNGEMRDFDLTNIQSFLKDKLNIKVYQGRVNVYAELEYKGENIEGYIKPFVTGLKMSGLTTPADTTVASKIPVGRDQKFRFEIMKDLVPGIENRIGPRRFYKLQAQEPRL